MRLTGLFIVPLDFRIIPIIRGFKIKIPQRQQQNGPHLDHRELLADAIPRALFKWPPRVFRLLVWREEAVRVELVGVVPDLFVAVDAVVDYGDLGTVRLYRPMGSRDEINIPSSPRRGSSCHCSLRMFCGAGLVVFRKENSMHHTLSALS